MAVAAGLIAQLPDIDLEDTDSGCVKGREAGLLHLRMEGGTAFGRRQELQLPIRRSQGTVAGL